MATSSITLTTRITSSTAALAAQKEKASFGKVAAENYARCYRY
jgi:hypothetical protein